MKADLHNHTTFSDGVNTPEEIAAMASRSGIDLIAVTDHDTMSGVPDAVRACARHHMGLIPGVEISAGPDGRTHILCYIRSTRSDILERHFTDVRSQRAARAEAIIEKLARLGYPLESAVFSGETLSSIGRPHIARALVSAGYCGSVKEAFDQLLGDDAPAYIPLPQHSAEDIIRLIRRSGGVAVAAHPVLLHLDDDTLRSTLRAWKDAGLQGLEVYHPKQSDDYRKYLSLAREYRLLVTGGSDYHADPLLTPGCTAAAWESCGEDIARLLEEIDKPGAII